MVIVVGDEALGIVIVMLPLIIITEEDEIMVAPSGSVHVVAGKVVSVCEEDEE